MNLISLTPAKRNTAVKVNGKSYDIDSDGICRNVLAKDAGKLLQNSAWREWDGKATTTKAARAGSIGLITTDGSVLKKDEKPTTPPTTPLDSGEPSKEWDIPGEGEDWPDPVADMPIEYLKAMADAYEVKYSKKPKAKELVKKILTEMYPYPEE
jgi:hypothetical protein